MRLITLLLTLPLLGQAPVAPPPAPTPAPVANLNTFFLQSCAMCHGTDGSAVRPDGKKTGAQDLTSGWWQRHTRNDEIVDAILHGRRPFLGPKMPPFQGRISEADAMKLATEVVRKLQKGVPVKVVAPTPAPAK